MGKQNTAMVRRIVDIFMTVLLLFLMAYQVTGEALHEWIGMGMTLLVIIHQILNRRWYASVFKGRYHAYRTLTTAVNVLLILSFAVTAFCGMSMSGHAVPFLYGIVKVSFARRMHLSLSHWSFVLMGLHLGLHIPVMTAKWKLPEQRRLLVSGIFCVIAGIGLFLFIRNGMPDYLFFRVPFAFLDYEKSAALVLLENIIMLLFWAFVGAQAFSLCRNTRQKSAEKKNALLPVIFIMAAVIIGLVLSLFFSNDHGQESGSADWSAPQDPAEVQDGFLLIDGGTYQMGSPESENWRIEDEVQHEVTVSPFYVDAYETTQTEYERLMGGNPTTFRGDRLCRMM